LTLFALACLEQDAVALYWRQVHHKDSPIDGLKRIPAWASGARLSEPANDAKQALIAEIARFDAKVVASFNAGRFGVLDTAVEEGGESDERNVPVPLRFAMKEMTSPSRAKTPSLSARDALERLPEPVLSPAPLDTPADVDGAGAPGEGIALGSTDSVLFVGDSLMQGIAPHVNSSLYKRYAIHGIDLSRQSTGLSYPGFFNWPEQIEKAFRKAPEIKLMVVFLGPNDPWDFPNEKHKPYLKFKSEDWESAYRVRIREVLEIARKNDARVFWLEVPCMRKKDLDTRMAYLNRLFSDEVKKSGEIFLPTGKILGCEKGEFSSFMNSNGKKKKSRIDDGVHFTIAGQKRVADEILFLIRAKPRRAAR
jgi:hypothetical protein